MSDYSMIRPFDVDDGQLDGLSSQQCFVLGYELAMIDGLLEKPEGFEQPIHANNMERIKIGCLKAKREFTIVWMDEDVSESWMWLKVSAKQKDS